ncbi:MAG: S8 family serine peptidase [Alphaproteobacteria bacterium]|nr:S8 family serine peptidase [Alphaproteobacteria bacterium]
MKIFSSDMFEGRLRTVGRSSVAVNSVRAELCGGVRVAKQKFIEQLDLKLQRSIFEAEQSVKAKPERLSRLKKGVNDAATNEIEVEVFAQLASEDATLKSQLVTGRRGRICTLRGTLEDINKLSNKPGVVSVRLADTLQSPRAMDEGLSDDAHGPPIIAGIEQRENAHHFGENILVGIVDVGGFDFAHPDFLDEEGKTRFTRIWDQADQAGRHRKQPKNYDYGGEITDEHMNHAIASSQSAGLPAHLLEPQSQMAAGSHGTHVASIAAGKSGICRHAKIAGVLLSLPTSELDRRLSFYDTARIVHAVDYLLDIGKELEVDAVTVNISLGTNGGAHDDSSAMSRWIDYALTQPGRAVCVAAGNAGQEAPQHARDIGFIMGRIHTSGRIVASDLETRLDWVVVGDGIEDISENELEIWYAPQDRIAVQVRPPGGDWTTMVKPGEFMKNKLLPDRTVLSIFNELYDTGNGHNRISIYLAPFMTQEAVVGIAPGVWSVRLIGQQIRDGRYHGWIERDDPMEIARIGERAYWRFPSFFAEATNVDNSSISTLACGARIVGVANLDADQERINPSSSQGPTRDGREKPDIAAPGTNILAANGFDDDARWIAKSGTSMASPYVAGVAGLMLAIAPQLTAAQIIGILRRTAAPLPGHTFEWRNDAGFGEIDVGACLDEALAAGEMRDVGAGD